MKIVCRLVSTVIYLVTQPCHNLRIADVFSNTQTKYSFYKFTWEPAVHFMWNLYAGGVQDNGLYGTQLIYSVLHIILTNCENNFDAISTGASENIFGLKYVSPFHYNLRQN